MAPRLLHFRSLPSGITATGTPPVDASTDTSAMANKPSQPVILPILIPVAIALGIYLALFHLILPTWRAHRERYRQYLPMHTSSRITSHLPHFLQPSTISSALSSLALRTFFPTTYALRQLAAQQSTTTGGTTYNSSDRTTYRASASGDDSDADSDDTPLFTAESGEAMLSFGVPHANSDPRDIARRRRENMERFAGRNLAYARAMEDSNPPVTNPDTSISNTGLVNGARPHNDVHPERRLSRELEAGFLDDSDEDEEADDRRGVTVGRRSFSVSRGR